MFRNWRFYTALLVAGLGISLGVALLSPLASPDPDGLERVAEDKGFIDEGQDAPYEIIPDYAFPGVENEALATILAGVVGVLIVAALVLAFAFVVRLTKRQGAAPAAQARDRL